MKIPSSSSLLFATLAISSSSSSLAAPAGDAPQSEGGMSSSPSNHHMAARRGSTTTRGLRPADMEVGADTPSKRSMAYEIEARDMLALCGPLEGLPVIGAALKPVIDKFCVGAASAESLISDGDLVQFQKAISLASGAITAQLGNVTQKRLVSGSLPDAVPVALPGLPRGLFAAMEVDPETKASSTVGTWSSSATPTMAAAAADDTSSASSPASGNPASLILPKTPALPMNPPNTPAMSMNPVLPISPLAPALPIAQPAPRDLPIALPVALPAAPVTLPTGVPAAAPDAPPLFSKLPVMVPLPSAAAE